MKPLSQSLQELSGRIKVLEDSATATFEADRGNAASGAPDRGRQTRPPALASRREIRRVRPYRTATVTAGDLGEGGRIQERAD